MNELCRVALEVQSECEKHHWRFVLSAGWPFRTGEKLGSRVIWT